MSATSKAGLIAELRARIAKVAAVAPCMAPGMDAHAARSIITTGASEIDAALPGGGLKRGALHEIVAADYRDMGAALGFATALAARCAAPVSDASVSDVPVLWCEGGHAPFDVGAFYGPGLAQFGLDPARLILVSPPREVDLLWTMEEALRLGAFAAVIGEIDGRAARLDLTATRRLQLAAEEKETPAFLLTGHASAGASAAVTRWRVAAAPSGPVVKIAGLVDLLGRPRWQVCLERCRGVQGGILNREWLVEWDASACLLHDASVGEALRATSAPRFRRAG